MRILLNFEATEENPFISYIVAL